MCWHSKQNHQTTQCQQWIEEAPQTSVINGIIYQSSIHWIHSFHPVICYLWLLQPPSRYLQWWWEVCRSVFQTFLHPALILNISHGTHYPSSMFWVWPGGSPLSQTCRLWKVPRVGKLQRRPQLPQLALFNGDKESIHLHDWAPHFIWQAEQGAPTEETDLVHLYSWSTSVDHSPFIFLFFFMSKLSFRFSSLLSAEIIWTNLFHCNGFRHYWQHDVDWPFWLILSYFWPTWTNLLLQPRC